MRATQYIISRLATAAVAIAIASVGFLFFVLGLTFLPVVGILIAVPVLALSMYFLRLPVGISLEDEQHVGVVCGTEEHVCALRPLASPGVS